MHDVSFNAPGKLVLAGEYVVLGGAPALSMAVDRRARVDIGRATGGSHVLRCPGYVDGDWRFRADARGNIEWLDEPPARDSFALLECVWRTIGAAIPWQLSIVIDTVALHDRASGQKLGLGSSAAVAVAAIAAMCRLLGRDDDARELTLAAHRGYQDGRGSGVDVATSLHGGIIEFSSGHVRRSLTWPDGLRRAFFWSGRSVSTAEKLRLFGARDASTADSASAAELADAARRVARLWAQGTSQQIVTVFGEYTHVLQQFDAEHDLGIFGAGHRVLTEIADGTALVYKPCGAGGGDIGVMLAIDDDVASEFTERATAAGFAQIGLGPDADGVAAATG